MFKKIKSSEAGFTLMELIIVFVAIGVLTAIAIPVYNGLIISADKTGITQNISKLEGMVEQYAGMNGGSLNGLSAASLQGDGLLPANWTTNGYSGTPPNQNLVSSYSVASNGTWYNGGVFEIDISGNNTITNTMARSICVDFENQITAFSVNGGGFNISTGGTNCNNIPSNSNLVSPNTIGLAF